MNVSYGSRNPPVGNHLWPAAADVSVVESAVTLHGPGGSASVEQFAHFLARLKGGHVLFRHQDAVARTRVAPRARPSLLGRENSKPAELHPIETRESLGNFAEYRVNDILDVALIQMRIARGDPLHQFGLDQDKRPQLN
jgi:hypothetical protein